MFVVSDIVNKSRRFDESDLTTLCSGPLDGSLADTYQILYLDAVLHLPAEMQAHLTKRSRDLLSPTASLLFPFPCSFPAPARMKTREPA